MLARQLHGGCSAQEARIRRDLACCYRLIAHLGWDDFTSTHISARLAADGEEFLINPYGMLFEEITASSLIKVNTEGEILSDSPYNVNRAGFVIHSAVHMARPDAQCVIHLHTRNGVAVSIMEGGLRPLSQTAMVIADKIAFHEHEGVSLDLDERARLQADLGNRNLMILRNHGTLALGRTVGEAFRRISLLERACSIQVAAMSMNDDIHHACPEVIRHTGERFDEAAMEAAASLLWPALVRKMERIDPSFADMD